MLPNTTQLWTPGIWIWSAIQMSIENRTIRHQNSRQVQVQMFLLFRSLTQKGLENWTRKTERHWKTEQIKMVASLDCFIYKYKCSLYMKRPRLTMVSNKWRPFRLKPFENRTICKPNRLLPFEYQTCSVFEPLLYKVRMQVEMNLKRMEENRFLRISNLPAATAI